VSRIGLQRNPENNDMGVVAASNQRYPTADPTRATEDREDGTESAAEGAGKPGTRWALQAILRALSA
jgi:hypothetical protein